MTLEEFGDQQKAEAEERARNEKDQESHVVKRLVFVLCRPFSACVCVRERERECVCVTESACNVGVFGMCVEDPVKIATALLMRVHHLSMDIAFIGSCCCAAKQLHDV